MGWCVYFNVHVLKDILSFSGPSWKGFHPLPGLPHQPGLSGDKAKREVWAPQSSPYWQVQSH